MEFCRLQPQFWIALLLLTAAVPVQAQFYYATNKGAITITGYAGPGGEVNVPAAVGGLPVVAIDNRTFYPVDRPAITNLVIPASVTNMGDQVIWSCPRLVAVTVDPLNAIYSTVDGVLLNKSQTELIAYPSCKPGNYIIPSTVISVRSNAFRASTYGSLLTGVTIPNGVGCVGDYAFADCRNLTNTTMARSLTNLGIFGYANCTKLGTVTVPGSITTIPGAAFDHCTSLTNVILMPGVSNIATVAFRECYRLTQLTLPDTLASIGESAFLSCTNLTTVRTGTNLLSVGNAAFRSCTALTNITLPNTLTNIGDGAFSWCANLQAVYCQGNAPGYIWEWVAPFEGCPDAIIFYLPGTTGWGATYAGRPTALWLPEVDANPATLGIHNNQFDFTISWASGMTVTVEACTNLANAVWSIASTNTLVNGSSHFSDPQWTNYSVRFYRLRWP